MKKCLCGKPLHYTSKFIEYGVKALIKDKGEFILVVQAGTGRKFLVSRHYIALHGIKGRLLHTYGFKEVTE